MSEDELPEGWATIPFEGLLKELRNGISTRPELKPPGTPILRINAVRPGRVLLDDLRYLPGGKDLADTFSVRDGDLMFTRYNGSLELLGVCGIVRGLGNTTLLYPDKLMRARLHESAVLPSFVELYFQSPEARERLTGEAKSSAGQQGISGSDLKRQPLAVAPLPEQHRIVEKVEALLAQVNKAKDRLDRVKVILKRFRHAVLAAACSGRLTEEWRAANGDVDVEDALEIAARERKASWLSGGRSRKESKYSVPPPAEADEGLPTSWRWTTGQAMFLWGSGAFLPKTRMRPGTVPVYGGNGISGYHDEALVGHRTLVVGRVGALCGNVHVTPGSAWITDNAIFAPWVASVLDLDFARMVLASRDLNANAGGSGQPFVSQELLDSQKLPFPPPEEQAEVVRIVQKMFALADTIETRVTTAASRAEKLPQTILSKAFKGELVPTEADLARAEGRKFETAEEMLRRVKAEGSEPNGSGGKMKRARKRTSSTARVAR